MSLNFNVKSNDNITFKKSNSHNPITTSNSFFCQMSRFSIKKQANKDEVIRPLEMKKVLIFINKIKLLY